MRSRHTVGERCFAFRHPLPGDTLALFASIIIHDRYYSVRGPNFVIPRVEAVDAHKAIAKARATKQKPLVRSSEAYMHTAVWQYGSQISMLTDGPDVLDVPEDWVSVAPAEQLGADATTAAVTSLVWVPSQSVGLVPVPPSDAVSSYTAPSTLPAACEFGCLPMQAVLLHGQDAKTRMHKKSPARPNLADPCLSSSAAPAWLRVVAGRQQRGSRG